MESNEKIHLVMRVFDAKKIIIETLATTVGKTKVFGDKDKILVFDATTGINKFKISRVIGSNMQVGLSL